MSDITIFVFGCGVMCVALAATFIASIAGDDPNASDTADSDRGAELESVPIRRANQIDSSTV